MSEKSKSLIRQRLNVDNAKFKKVIALVNKQAKDEGLWCEPRFASEDYIQRALKKLHKVITEEK